MRILLLIGSLILTGLSTSSAQIEQVSVGQNYAQQAYYNLETGEIEVLRNDAWDIAFSAEGLQDAGVFINESSGLGEEPLKVYVAPTTDWSEDLSNISELPDSLRLYNPDENWTEGALNTIKDPSNPFDYGWGIYTPQSNSVQGTKVFIIEKRDGSNVKFQVVQLTASEYSFRFAELDGSNEINGTVSKNDAGNIPLVYYSLRDEAVVPVPNDFHLIFSRYITPLQVPGSTDTLQYNVTGVITAPGVEAVVTDGVDPNTVNEADYAGDYSDDPLTIGHEWKYFDFSLGWIIDEDRVQFVKLPNGTKYKITFFDFEGSATGVTTLERIALDITSSDELSKIDKDIRVFPNPTTETFQVNVGDLNEFNVRLFDGSGRVLFDQNVQANELIQLPQNINTGIYYVQINNNQTVQKLVVKR